MFQLPPLPNFNVQTPDLLEQATRAASLKNMQSAEALRQQLAPYEVQEAQARAQQAAVQNQIAEQEMKSQQALVKAFGDPELMKKVTGSDAAIANGLGFDPDALTAELTARGVLPKDAMALTGEFVGRAQKMADVAKAQAQTGEANAAIRAKGFDSLQDRIASATSSPKAANQLLSDLVKSPQMFAGVPQDDLAHVYQALAEGDMDKLKAAGGALQIEKKIADYHKAQAEAKKAEDSTAGGPLQPVENAELQSFLANPPKGYKATATDFARWKASLAPAAQIQISGAAGGGMSDAAIDQAAERYHFTGQLPTGNRGVAGLAQNRKIMNRAAELFPGSMTEGTAEYKANADALKQLQTNADKVDAFETTATKNLDLFLQKAQKAVDSGIPILNAPARAASRLLGGQDQAAFETARQTAINEISRVLNSANATGVVSDSARKEVELLIKPDATVGQIMQAAKVLKQDMANRRESYQEQIADIKKRMGGQTEDEKGHGAANQRIINLD